MVGGRPGKDEALVAIAAIGIALFINLDPHARMAECGLARQLAGAITGDTMG